MASNPPLVRTPPRPPIRTAPGDGTERALQRSLCRPQPNRGLMQRQPVRISVWYRRTQIFQCAPEYGLLICVRHRDQAVPNDCGCRSPWAHGSYCRLRGDGMREIVELCWSHEQDSAGFLLCRLPHTARPSGPKPSSGVRATGRCAARFSADPRESHHLSDFCLLFISII